MKDVSFDIVWSDRQRTEPFLIFQGPYGASPANYWGLSSFKKVLRPVLPPKTLAWWRQLE